MNLNELNLILLKQTLEHRKVYAPFDLKHVLMCIISKEIWDNNIFGIFITIFYEAYGFGENGIGQLGLGHSNQIKEFVKIPKLCGKKICEIYEGNNCMFAKNDYNEILSWGGNNWGQAGRGFLSPPEIFLEPETINFPENRTIIDISCGDHHNLALTKNGVVYGWGQNNFGQILRYSFDKIINSPKTINFKLESGDEITGIHCFCNSSFALTKKCNVYFWGEDLWGVSILTAYERVPQLININASKLLCNFDGLFYLLNDKLHQLNSEEFLENVDDFTFDENLGILLKRFNKIEMFNIKKTIPTEYKSFDEYFLVNFQRTYKSFVINQEIIQEKFEDKSSEYSSHSGNSSSLSVEMKRCKIETWTNKRKDIIDDLINRTSFEKIDGKYKSNFEEIAYLGSGTYGRVNKVRDISNNEYYAIKTFWIKDESFCKSIAREIQIISDIKSIYTVDLICAWIEENDLGYFQMELCEGNFEQFLNSKLKTFNRVVANKTNLVEYFFSCELLFELTDCLKYLHNIEPPILHRDLKPSNILITNGKNSRCLKITDFGFATIQELSSHSIGVGTPKFMAPEVGSGRQYNLKADIYSLGKIAEILFNFDIEKTLKEHEGNFNKEYTEIESLLSDLLNKSPSQRPDCVEILERIKRCSLKKSIILSEYKSLSKKQIHLIKKSEFYSSIYSKIKTLQIRETV